MVRPFLFLFGYKRLRVGISYAGEVLNLCRQRGFVYRNFSFCGEHACLEASLRTSKKILSACRDRGIPLVVGEACGLPALLLRYRQRWGIFAGVLAFALIVFCSGRVIWSIRVEGNRQLSDAQVLEELERCGMRVGDLIGDLDTAALENRMLIESDEISWISINLVGTVAKVEIREVAQIPEEETYAASNLVASNGGTIEWLEDIRGNIAVKIGDSVGEGDLLVGGIYETVDGGLRYTRAKGKVFARTKRDFSVEIPLSYEKKVYTGEVKTEKSLIFFKKEVKFFGNSGNSYGTCDTINTVEYFELPSGVTLPIGIRTVRYLEYETETVRRDGEAAMELAYYRLRCVMEGEAPEGMLMRKQIETELTDDAYHLRCRAEYIENIALVKEIEIEGLLSGPRENR